jgi:D-serine dehydratase
MDLEGIRLEPSACAGFRGLLDVQRPDSVWEKYLKTHDLKDYMDQATHIVWGTGGGLMPEDETF